MGSLLPIIDWGKLGMVAWHQSCQITASSRGICTRPHSAYTEAYQGGSLQWCQRTCSICFCHGCCTLARTPRLLYTGWDSEELQARNFWSKKLAFARATVCVSDLAVHDPKIYNMWPGIKAAKLQPVAEEPVPGHFFTKTSGPAAPPSRPSQQPSEVPPACPDEAYRNSD